MKGRCDIKKKRKTHHILVFFRPAFHCYTKTIGDISMPLPHLLNDITKYCVHYSNNRKSRDFLQYYKKGSKIYYVAILEKKRESTDPSTD